ALRHSLNSTTFSLISRVSVASRHLDCGVAQYGRDRERISARVRESCRRSMAQIVKPEALNLRVPKRRRPGHFDPIHVEYPLPSSLEVFEGRVRSLIHRYSAIFATLCIYDIDQPAREVYVTPLQTEYLAASHSRVECDYDDGS